VRVTGSERGQAVGHPKVRNQHTDRVQGVDEEVGGPQVPVQDAQPVQVHQARERLLQQGQDTGQGQAALGQSKARNKEHNVIQKGPANYTTKHERHHWH
jgi:hypothetical protein